MFRKSAAPPGRGVSKPFKPPLQRAVPAAEKKDAIDLVSGSDSDDVVNPRPYKKRKLLTHIPESPVKKVSLVSVAVSAPRKPLLAVRNPIETKPLETSTGDLEGYYMVLWRKFSNKKHKNWEGDGLLAVYEGYANLKDTSGRSLGRTMYKDPLLPGSTLSIGGKEIEIDSIISKADYLSGKHFINGGAKSTAVSAAKASPAIGKATAKLKISVKNKTEPEAAKPVEISPALFYGENSETMAKDFKSPMISTTIMPKKAGGGPTARHDPNAPGALIMKRPTDSIRGKQIVDVVVDPFLAKHLRPHQREGIQFLYECVMGLRDFNGQGALLADEMGLGKTLQTIALIWTLLKQNPYHGSDGPTSGIIKKALIVCPVTVINNWKKEFNKWLGNERIGVYLADGNKKTKLTDFTHGKSYSVMIIGYEKLITVQDELKKGGGIDIVIADEGHRLKTAGNKSAEAIRSLNTERRVILSGTPLQNDLSEFFTMVDFINPGLLGTFKTFKKEFELPIARSREPGASARDIEKGNAREEELSSTTKPFILRRTAEVNSKYLLSKSEYVLFCKPTQAQAQVYQYVLESPAYGKILGGSAENSLGLIQILKKVCNAPSLLTKKDTDSSPSSTLAQLLETIPAEILQKKPVMASVKFRVLDRMVKELRKTEEKLVIVSNYTTTLDIIGQHLTTLDLPFLRLDGSTPTAKRQDLIDAFNKTPASRNFAFLLSAKSGGVGINLIGASRLILFDVDWNPATDLQAMARIHREGQKRPVKIYRFLMAGGMDEKIYQRQVTKMGLADSVVDGKKNEASFSAQELRDLFRLDTTKGCQTHDLLGCDCKGVGSHPPPEVIDLIDQEETPTDESEIDSDSDDDLLPLHLVPATKANVAAINRRVEKQTKKTSKMQALMKYAHLDTTIFDGEEEDVFGHERDDVTHVKEVLDDAVLFEVLKDMRCKVDYVFAKKG